MFQVTCKLLLYNFLLDVLFRQFTQTLDFWAWIMKWGTQTFGQTEEHTNLVAALISLVPVLIGDLTTILQNLLSQKNFQQENAVTIYLITQADVLTILQLVWECTMTISGLYSLSENVSNLNSLHLFVTSGFNTETTSSQILHLIPTGVLRIHNVLSVTCTYFL